MADLKLITFDLDNTLWDVETVIRQAEADMVAWIRANAASAIEHYQLDTVTEIRTTVAEAFPDQRHDLSFMRTEVLRHVMLRAGFAESRARELAEQAFDVFFHGRNRVEFFPGAIELLTTLSGKYTLYALTNGNADIGRTGLDRYLAGAVSSADVGQSKPHAAMFEAALAEVSSQPDEAIHIGDHLVDDIEGAGNVGIHTIWVNLKDAALEAEHSPPTETVTNLPDVEHAVERIASRLS